MAENRFKYHNHDYAEYAPIDRKEVANRIKNTLPNSKIILVLRNQVDWITCHYRNFYTLLDENKRSLSSFLTCHEGKLIADAASFDETVSVYQELFGQSNVLVLLLEDMAISLQLELDKICDFIQVDHHIYDPIEKNYHRGVKKEEIIQWANNSNSAACRKIKLFLRSFFGKKKVESVQYSGSDIITESERDMIEGMYGASNLRLSKLINRDVSDLGYSY